MEALEKSSKTRLEASNQRLTSAFRHLQDVIDRQLQAAGQTPQHDTLLKENNHLKQELAFLSQEYASLKKASMDAFTHLNQSINQLENLIIHNDSANS